MLNIFKIDIHPRRNYGLDILRCLAIMFVLIGHGNHLLPPAVSKFVSLLVYDGVTIFFVLSGFLIGGILIKQLQKEPLSFKMLINFWQRRWFRTLPNYFLVLIVICILQYFHRSDFNLIAVNRFFVFSQNLVTPHSTWFFPEAWSLSVEEWFYLLIPLLILLLSFFIRISGRYALLATSVIILCLVTGFRFYRYTTVSEFTSADWDLIFRKQVFTRLDSLMFGVIGAYVAFFYNSIWLRYKIFLFVTGVILLVVSNYIPFKNSGLTMLYHCVFSFSVTSIGTLFLIPYLSQLKQGNGVVYKAVTYISLISYSLYLINYSVVYHFMLRHVYLGDMNMYGKSAIKYLLFWVFTFAISTLLYKYYEVPTTKLRDR